VAESFIKGMNNINFQGTGNRVKRCNETVVPACESGPDCDADIIIVFDKNLHNEAGLFDFQEKVAVIGRWLTAFTQSYQLGLITFDTTTSSVDLVMSLNNRGAFETAVGAITLGSGSDEVLEYRNSDEALQRILDGEAGAWRSGSQRLVILVSQGMPHGGDTIIDVADLTAQIALVDDIHASTVRVSTIAVPYYLYSQTGNVPYFVSGVEGHLALLASASHGDGNYDAVQTNGADDNNEGVNVLVNAMMNSFTQICTNADNTTATAGCCSVLPCTICLQWIVAQDYPDDPLISYGYMSWNGERWTGEVDGMIVEAYWDGRRNCAFFVEADGIIVYSAPRCATLDDYGTPLIPDEELASCRTPGGTTTVERLISAYETEVGELLWILPPEYELTRRPAVEPQPCLWDVVFVIDNDKQNQFNTEQLQSGALQPIVDWVELVADSAQFGLVIFDATGATEVLPLTSDSDAFIAAVNSIDAGTWPPFPFEADSDRRSDLAVRYANQMTGWRSSAQKRMVLINQGSPSDPSDLSDQQLQASASLSKGIRIHGVSTAFTADDGSYAALFSTTVALNRYMALTTQGKYFTGNAVDQTPPTIPTQILTSLQSSEQCQTEGGCADFFCGNCDCIPEELCLTINDICKDRIPFTGDFCSDGLVIGASWKKATLCDYYIEVYLERATEDFDDEETGQSWNEGDCLFRIEITAPDEQVFDFLDVVTCPNLGFSGSFYLDPYTLVTFSLARVFCDGCELSVCAFDNCCPGSYITENEFTGVSTNLVSGALGCPDAGTYNTLSNGRAMAPTGTELVEVLVPDAEVCSVFRSVGSFNNSGLITGVVYESILFCTLEGPKAFLKYSTAPAGFPTGTWIETLAGIDCPDCTTGDISAPKQSRAWYDVYQDCSVCETAAYEYEPVEGCGSASQPEGYSSRDYFLVSSACISALGL
jgi:hypothetical protein